MWVFDATPLIYLAKVDALAPVRHLDEACVIPERVYREVVEIGIEEGCPDARRVERSVEDGVFDVVTVAETQILSRLRENTNLSDADAAVLAHAGANDGVAVMDETYGRDVAAVEDITTRGTAYIVLSLASRDVLDADEARATVDAMVEAGWYCAPDVYVRIVRKLDSLAD